MKLLFFICVFGLFFARTLFDSTSQRKQYILDLNDLLNDRKIYDKNFYPPHPDGPIKVNLSIVIGDLKKFSETTMTFELDIYMTQIWNDPRLIMDNVNYTNLGYTSLQPDFMNLLWLPDTYFPNVQQSMTSSSDNMFTHKTVLKINNNGNVFLNERISMTPNCNMNLVRYPFDRQMCRLSVESYSISNKTLKYEWDSKSPTKFKSPISLPDYILENFTSVNTVFVVSETEAYSRLNLCFVLQRKTLFYFMGLYGPATLVVIVGWLASIKKNSTFSDLVAVMLAQFFLYFSYATVMPKVSDVKALDIFLATSFVFTFLCLVQKFLTREQSSSQEEQSSGAVKRNQVAAFQAKVKETTNTKSCCKIIHQIVICCFLPVMFALFCSLYYVAYAYLVLDNMSVEKCMN